MHLVVLAAGMGSRFGGLKQLEPMDEYGNFIIDYSIHDAIKAGFDSVILIIKKEHEEIFKSTIGKRISKIVKVEYAFQDLNDLPSPYKCPEGREKPWGTAHALYAARHLIKDNFIIINGDDYYGPETYEIAYQYLNGLKKGERGQYANVAFKVENTITSNGDVKRGVCFEKNGMLTKLVESSIGYNKDGVLEATPLDGSKGFLCEKGQLVSMNLFCFSKDFIDYIVSYFPEFLQKEGKELKSEYLIPALVDELVNQNKASLKLLSSPSKWHGVTYKEDKPEVVNALQALTNKGLYKKGLY